MAMFECQRAPEVAYDCRKLEEINFEENINLFIDGLSSLFATDGH